MEDKHRGKKNMQDAVKLIKKKILFLESEFAKPIIDTHKNFIEEVSTFNENENRTYKFFNYAFYFSLKPFLLQYKIFNRF